MAENIDAIAAAKIDNFANGRANLNSLIKTIDEGSFRDVLLAIHFDSKDAIVKELKDSATVIKNLSDNTSGYGQKLIDNIPTFDRLQRAVLEFQKVLNAIRRQPSFLGVTQPDRLLAPFGIERVPRKVLPPGRQEPARVPPLPFSPPPSPPERILLEPAGLPPIELPEARSLGATPLQEVSAPPARVDRNRNPKAPLELSAPAAQGVASMLSSIVAPILSPSAAPKVGAQYVAPAGPDLIPAPVIAALPDTTRSRLPLRVPGDVSAQPVPQALEPPGHAPAFSLLNLGTNPTPATSLAPQSTPLTSGEQRQFLKGSYKLLQQRDSNTTICEYRYPTVYKLLESGIFNGSDIISLLNSNDPKLSELFTAIGYDRDAKTIMGHPIAEIYRACHPDRALGDQENLTRIFQVLKALEAYTGQTQPVNNLENVDPDDESYWADDDPRWDQDDSSDFLKRLISDLNFPKTNVPSVAELIARIKASVDQSELSEKQIQNRKDYIKNHIRKFMRETIEKCTDRALALRRESNMNKLLEFLVDGYPFKVSSVVVQQIKDVIHDEPGKGVAESKTLRFFLNSVVKVLQARNIKELNQRLIETKGVVHAIFYQEQWCAKPNVALDVKQEIYRGRLKAKWIDETRQGLTLTSDGIRPDKANGISSKTITISRGDCFSFNTEGVKTCAPKFVLKESKNHFTVENITEVPTGFSLSILQYLSGSVIRSSRFPILLAKSSVITCFVNGIDKKDCPKGVGLTPQITLPNDCPKKLLDAQFKVVAAETKSRNLERQVTTCEATLTKLRAELDKVLHDNEEETARLRAGIARDQAKLAELQASKDDMDSQLAELRRKRDLMQGHLNNFGGQLKESERVKADLVLERARLEAQISILEFNKEGDKAQSDRNIAQISELRQKYAGVTERLKTAAQEQGELQTQYAQTQAQLRAAEASVADLDSRFASTDALITAADKQISEDLENITEIINEGIEELTAGLDRVIGLTNGTRSDIAEARQGFTEEFSALQDKLKSSDLASRTEILQAIASLKEQNQRDMAALQANLAQTATEKDLLQAQLSQEQSAKAAAEGQVTAKNEEIARKDQQHAAALQAARQAAADTAEQVKAANDRALKAKNAESDAIAAGLDTAYRGNLEVLSGQLDAALARSGAAEASVADRAGLEAELVRVRAAIAAIPPPAPVAAAVVAPLPIIAGREPPVETAAPQGSNIRIQWDSRRTPGPWILRIDYDGANPDFQEVTAPEPIVYTVKRPGALSGRIYSVTVV